MSSCQTTDKSQSYIDTGSISESLAYDYDSSANETTIRWATTLTNNTIYDFDYFDITFELYLGETKVDTATLRYEVTVGRGSNYTGRFNFVHDGEIDRAVYAQWTTEYLSFWDTYDIWIIVTASIAGILAIIYVILMIVNDWDIEEFPELIGDFFFDHPVIASIIVIALAGSSGLAAIITANWVPVLIVLGGILAVVIVYLIAHLIKHIVEEGVYCSGPSCSRYEGEDYRDDMPHVEDVIGDKEAMQKFTVAELKDFCQYIGIVGYSKMNKSELIDYICMMTEDGGEADGEGEIKFSDGQKKKGESRNKGNESSASKQKGITFDDIAGLDEAKNAFKEKVVYAFTHRELYEKYGKKVGGGILLYGLPGTGKTMFAEAASNETDSLFIPVKCSDIKSKWYGESEANVKKIFAKAKKAGKAIIFFDEFEAIGAKRTDDGDNGNNDLVPQILAEMQGVGSSSEKAVIVVIAATNKPWSIDSAFLRPGRFDEKIYVPLPDLEARKKMFELKLAGLPQKDLDYANLAEFTEGFNGADIGAFCDKLKMVAINKSISENAEHIISMEDAMEVKETIQSSVSPDDIARLEEFKKTNR